MVYLTKNVSNGSKK